MSDCIQQMFYVFRSHARKAKQERQAPDVGGPEVLFSDDDELPPMPRPKPRTNPSATVTSGRLSTGTTAGGSGVPSATMVSQQQTSQPQQQYVASQQRRVWQMHPDRWVRNQSYPNVTPYESMDQRFVAHVERQQALAQQVCVIIIEMFYKTIKLTNYLR